MNKIIQRMNAQIKREFLKRYDANANIRIVHRRDETIHVYIDSDHYVMQISSDDDQFIFECDNANAIIFDIDESIFDDE
jgi:hypothetical protein